jgi:glucokinase
MQEACPPMPAPTADPDHVLVGDLGGTQLRVAVAHPSGALLHRAAQPTPPNDPDALLRLLRAVRDRAMQPLAAAVVGVPGVVDHREGRVLGFPNLPGWDGAVSQEALAAGLGLPVLLANDADLAALGEHRYGAGRGLQDMVYVTVSTGIGAGIIIGGRLLRARYSLAEVGQSIIDWQSGEILEAIASGTALAQAGGREAPEVVMAARQGEPAALAVMDRAARALAAGMLNLVRYYAPEAIVVGGGVASAGDLLLGTAQRLLATRAGRGDYQPRIIPGALGDDAGLLGAAAFWYEATDPSPCTLGRTGPVG